MKEKYIYIEISKNGKYNLCSVTPLCNCGS